MRIQQLSIQLANQIAAGEVVERPASVVKELLENAIDAKASHIEIEIEKSGVKRILIRDNGIGIAKDDLALALARHATSKIGSLQDLENVLSLGFRGEALASISSVSRLSLTSKTATQENAWQVRAQGREMQTSITPAAHPVGTTVIVEDLFFNTPARRQFLRADKTEFFRIEEIVKHVVLSHFHIAFTFKHNQKTLLQLPVANTHEAKQKRVAKICGSLFSQNAMWIEESSHGLLLSGWVADAEFTRSQSDGQYCYLNNRMLRDKLINHAIRQAYADLIYPGRYPAYVLYLEMV